jgi:fructose/tagatose bisphosphate aldolase
MIYTDIQELCEVGKIKIVGDTVEIEDLDYFCRRVVNNLADTLILSNSIEFKKFCRWLIYQVALKVGITPCSIQELYKARAAGGLESFTVPALNLRTLTYDTARSVFRVAKKLHSAAFIFEIAKSEIGYTYQDPYEYTACVLLAALKEGYRGPVFIQGDHFQVNPERFFKDKNSEIEGLKKLIREAIKAGFYNIDIDSSMLVDLNKPTIAQQQELNSELTAVFTKHVRQLQPEGIDICIGGEIGEVGKRNSTPQDLAGFMDAYLKQISGYNGISKISVQTGTFHGGVVLPDGSIAKVKIDFDTLKELSAISRQKYSMAGAVQHGASTLPSDAFHHFPEVDCVEIHLATQFQNIVYDYLPLPLKEEIYAWLDKELSCERAPGQTDDQFIYKIRKKALGPFKRQIYSLPRDVKHKISFVLEKEFFFLFEKLNVANTKEVVDKYIHPIKVNKNKADFCIDEES